MHRIQDESLGAPRGKLIVLYPYPFQEFHWKLLELTYFSGYLSVDVFDLSNFLNKEFSKKLKVERENKAIKIDNLRNFLSEYILLKKWSRNHKIIILNEIQINSFKSLLCSLLVNKLRKYNNVAIVEYFNHGVPIYEREANRYGNSKSSLLRRVIYKIKSVTSLKEFSSLVYQFLLTRFLKDHDLCSHILVAGDAYYRHAQDRKYKAKIMLGHSSDFSSCRIYSEGRDAEEETKTAVLLDGAGPRFTSDSFLLNRKVFFTSEVWYPSLVRFFNIVEAETGVTFEIAGHYKSDHPTHTDDFGRRRVRHNCTREMVESANFVATRCSTAISFAIAYRKPIIFIYSDQLAKDSKAINSIFCMARLLGVEPINIDEFQGGIERYLRVNQEKFEAYEREFLTSAPDKGANYEIILRELVLEEGG